MRQVKPTWEHNEQFAEIVVRLVAEHIRELPPFSRWIATAKDSVPDNHAVPYLEKLRWVGGVFLDAVTLE